MLMFRGLRLSQGNIGIEADEGRASNLDFEDSIFSLDPWAGYPWEVSQIMTRLEDHLEPAPALVDLVEPLADALADALGVERGATEKAP